jgi:hypothetical protein
MSDEHTFTNERGNLIRLTIEGPTSASVNELTERETVEVAAIVREYVEKHPHLEKVYRERRLEKPSGTARRALDCFRAPSQHSVAEELRIYSTKLRTWTLAEEEVGNVRPLLELLNAAAKALAHQTAEERE